MEKREAFINCISKDSVGAFLHFIQLNKDASDPFNLSELLEELPRKQKEKLWERLKNLLTAVLLENPVDGWQRFEDDCEDQMEIERGPEMKQTLDIIHGIASVVTTSVSVVNENENYKALLECAIILNGILYALPESEKKLQTVIQHLCVTWWDKGLDAKEELGKSALIILLRKSLTSKTGADICRLWHIHPALLCFDYDLEESQEIKDMLLQSFMSANHVKKEEGRRFLSFLFSWNINFIKMIHGTIKNQLQCFPKSLMVHIAEIYFRAWKKASGKTLEVIENGCIQDFMHYGVHLPRNSPVHSKVREVLSYFHHQQKCRQGVEEMLCRLYQPILWRGLKARNSEVRSNAALLFVEAFPIRDPNLNSVEMDNEIQKQFDELYSLLEDPQPLVRSTGILGVSKITSKYWEMMPATILADLLKKVIGDLACDVSSADVRCSVFKCLPTILDNKLSHPLLEQLLPALKYSLHDNSEKVRVAFVDMLLKIKAVRAAKFWKVCSMEHLLARLEFDSRPVSRRIVNLLFNSFLPVNEPEEVWCERCVTLIQMNPAAARKFYQYAYEYTAPTNIAKLMHTIRHCLNACIQRAEKDCQEDDSDSEEENRTVLNDVLSVNDVASMASLLEIIVILWKSIHKALEYNKEAKVYTISKFAAVLPGYLKVFKDDRCIIPLITLISFLPPSAIPPFSCSVISTLRNQEQGVAENKYHSLIDCLCRWGQVGHILELICDWLPDGQPQRKNSSTSLRRVQIQDTREARPELALAYMEYLLTHTENRDCLLSAPTNILNNLLKALETSKAALESILQSSDATFHNFNQVTALRAFSLYCRLSIHLQHKFSSEERTYMSVLEDTRIWIENNVLPLIHKEEEEEHLTHNSEVYQQIIQAYLTVCKDVIMVGLGNSKFQLQFLNLTLAIIQTERGSFCVPVLLNALKDILAIFSVHNTYSDEEVTEIFDAVQKVFQKMLECVVRSLKKKQEGSAMLLRSIQIPLDEFICAVQAWHMNTAVQRGVFSTLLALMVVEISHGFQKASNKEELAPPESLSDLPPFSQYLLTIIIKSTNIVRSFLHELLESITFEDIEGIRCLSAAVHMLMIISKCKHKGLNVKSVAATLERKLKTFMEITLEEDSIERTLYESSLRALGELLNL